MDFCTSTQLDGSGLTEQIEALLSWLRPTVAMERRRDDRVPVPVLFRLTPLGSQREPVHDDAITVVGKDISQRGLSFFHEQSLTYRRAIVSLELADGQRFAAEIDVNWCRFTRPGWYESGGRLVRAVNFQPLPILHRTHALSWEETPLAENGCC